MRDADRIIEITLPPDTEEARRRRAPGLDLRRRFRKLPAEVLPEDSVLVLTPDGDAMQTQIAHARREESAWPTVSYLWGLHPDWFRGREQLRAATGRARVRQHLELQAPLLSALGYAEHLRHRVVALPSGHLPLLGALRRPDGSPLLWLVPVVQAKGSELGTLASPLAPEQLAVAAEHSPLTAGQELAPTGEVDAEQLVTEAFGLEEPPRFILVVGEDDLFLLERGKWSEQRLLRFDLP